MNMINEWFYKAVHKQPPNSLGGWSKNKPINLSRRNALRSRPSNWTLQTRYLSVAKALQTLANVTKNRKTKQIARRDAKYFYMKAKGMG